MSKGLRPVRRITGHSRDGSFQAIICTVTNRQTDRRTDGETEALGVEEGAM